MKPPAVPEADFAIHPSVCGKLLIRLGAAPRDHAPLPARLRAHAVPTLRIHALAGGEAIPSMPRWAAPMVPLCTPSLGLFGPACRPPFLPLL